ncbi:hypothetical protein EYZ11_011799 [Aspergillus tanneri]|uniref:Uncharacterized protein n=1 Tax=Aspergillus tanneri TaxID=1220188 RepID=A0A4S3J1U8_9EURO|nr:uncharacterized protein ATNIH1004_006839 [Aspergillus tanneri]KAA8645420.1 hypothetical protein ATNIH1004_006839 [Aspergillus tanneri]THC88749.1 hypothetical protein EYZ11_011799 [Aspergillus tanneri]
MGKPQDNQDSPDLPPPYEQAVTAPSSSSAFPTTAPAPVPIPGNSPYHSISPEARNSNQVTLSPELSQDASALHALITRQADIPPCPLLSVRGTHTISRSENHGRKHRRRNVTDFDFKIDLTRYVVGNNHDDDTWHELHVARDSDGEKKYRGGRFPSTRWRGHCCCSRQQRIRLPSPEDGEEHMGLVGRSEGDLEPSSSPGAEPGLIGWCERFCEDPGQVKSFTFKRTVTGLDSTIIRSALKSHLRALNYSGTVDISTSISNRSFTVYSPHWINRARNNNWIYYGCILLQLWVVTWPVIWLLEHRYEVVQSEWRFSRDITPGGNSKAYVTGQSEAAVAKDVAPVVTQAAWERRRSGNVLTQEETETLRRLEQEGRERGGRVVVVNWGEMGEWGTNQYTWAG